MADREAAVLDRQSLHHRQAKPPAHRDDALRRLGAVQLQHVRTQRLDDLAQHLVTGIDGERDLARPALHPLAQRARRPIAEIARRGCKEDKADLIGPCIQRRVQRLGSPQAADFHQKGHRSAFVPEQDGVLTRLMRFVLPRKALGAWVYSGGKHARAETTGPAAEK